MNQAASFRWRIGKFVFGHNLCSSRVSFSTDFRWLVEPVVIIASLDANKTILESLIVWNSEIIFTLYLVRCAGQSAWLRSSTPVSEMLSIVFSWPIHRRPFFSDRVTSGEACQM